MKKILILISVLFLLGCSSDIVCFDIPTPPYGPPDKEYHWNQGGIEYRKYTYYCYQDRYIEVTWSKYHSFCWEESEYISIDCELPR